MCSFAKEEDLLEFARAIRASDNPDPELEYIVTSLSEWQQPQQRRTSSSRKASLRTPDEGREGYSYRLFRWPAFVSTLGTSLIPRYWYWDGWPGLRIIQKLGNTDGTQIVLCWSPDIRKSH